MPYPHTAAPRHFSGQLLEKNAGCTHGLHQLALHLEDDDGASHIVYIAHGRGDDAAARCAAQYHGLTIGLHYYGSGTLSRTGDVHTHWMGTVTIKPCERIHRFAVLAGGRATTAGAAA
jgi:hypothetical protein